jgi:hypothetical protein
MLSKWLTDIGSGTKKKHGVVRSGAYRLQQRTGKPVDCHSIFNENGQKNQNNKKAFETYLQFLKKRVKTILV